MFEVYKLRMEFNERLCGSVPLSDQAIEAWLASRTPEKKPNEGASLEKIAKEVRATVMEEAETVDKEGLISLGFQQQDDGLVLRAGTLKAHIKDCSLQLFRAKIVKITSFRSKVANWVYISPYWLSILKANGEAVNEPDGEFTQSVHTMTRTGPINALKRIYYVDKPIVEAEIKLVTNPEISIDHLEAIFEYGSMHGYGGERGMGEGQYQFSIKKAVK